MLDRALDWADELGLRVVLDRYRTETTPAWCFRECVERGWLPARFQ